MSEQEKLPELVAIDRAINALVRAHEELPIEGIVEAENRLTREIQRALASAREEGAAKERERCIVAVEASREDIPPIPEETFARMRSSSELAYVAFQVAVNRTNRRAVDAIRALGSAKEAS